MKFPYRPYRVVLFTGDAQTTIYRPVTRMLRHTSLRRMCEKHGIQYANQRAHHVSDKHIWRYVQPTDEDFQSAVESFWD